MEGYGQAIVSKTECLVGVAEERHIIKTPASFDKITITKLQDNLDLCGSAGLRVMSNIWAYMSS